MTSRYRKKPVVVDAFQWVRDLAYPDWLNHAVSDGRIEIFAYGTDDIVAHISTLEGTMQARLGDWIVRGTKGEIYPVRADIFAEIYEKVDEGVVYERGYGPGDGDTRIVE